MLQDSFRNKFTALMLVLAIAAFVGATVFAVKSSLKNPDNSFLSAHEKGRWIKLDTPFRLNARDIGSEMTLFRRTFELDEPKEAILTLKAFKGAGIWLDGNPLRKFDGDMQNWREPVQIALPKMEPGKHVLKIAVVNESGHPALLAWSDELGISTVDGWEASRDDFVWNPAADAAETGSLRITEKFKRADHALLECLPYMLPLFLCVAGFVVFRDRGKLPESLKKVSLTPEMLRYSLLGLWAVMALNNFHDLPLKLGMDSVGHFKYIEYVGENLSLPSPVEGWQMFQPPLYYIISAVFYKFFMLFMDIESVLYWLRLIPLACGAAMIEISYRCARLAFAEDRFLQIAAILFGGFMPMNFAMAQFWGNEPLAAVFTGLTILSTLTILKNRDRRSLKEFALLGLFLGLAILSKATSSLLIPLVFFFIPFALFSEEDEGSVSKISYLRGIVLALIVTAVTGGWYYLKNWISYGKPFIGGWDKIREVGWWQDHGYRIWEHFTAFGSSILKPVYSTVNGIWDGLYATLWLDGNLSGMSRFASRPPWNDDLMVATALLALIPSLLILVGLGRVFWKPLKSVRNGRMFLAGCVIVYFTAVAYLYLNLPVYSTAKASYTLGLLPCYGILAALGLQPLLKNIYAEAAICGFLAVWGSTVYLTYFV